MSNTIPTDFNENQTKLIIIFLKAKKHHDYWLRTQDIIEINKELGTIFKSSRTTLPKYLKRLIEIGVLEEEEKSHTDKWNRKATSKHWRLRINKVLFDLLNEIATKKAIFENNSLLNLALINSEYKEEFRKQFLINEKKNELDKLKCAISSLRLYYNDGEILDHVKKLLENKSRGFTPHEYGAQNGMLAIKV